MEIDQDNIYPGWAGARVTVGPVEPRHFRPLYLLTVDPRYGGSPRFRARTPDPTSWKSEVLRGASTQLTICTRSDSQIVGLVELFNYDERNGIVHAGVTGAILARRSGLAIEALALALEHAFFCYPVRKVYLELREDLYTSLGDVMNRWCRLEGVFRDYEYCDGSYQDKYVVAIARADWADHAPDRLKNARPQREQL